MNTSKKITYWGLYLVFVTLLSGCDDILEVPDISNDVVSLIAPTEGATVQGNTTTFSWQSITDADAYVLQVAIPNFNNASQVVLDSTLTITSFTQTLLPNTYEWRVKAINSGFETIYSANNFIVQVSEGFAGNTLVLESPVNNFTINETEISLNWQALDEALEYRVQVLETNNTSVFDETISETSLDLTFTEGVFMWQVRAQNATENTLFSSRTITIDLTTPNTPTLDSPDNNESFNVNDIDFMWTREGISGSQERDTIFIYSDMDLENLVISAESSTKAFTTTLDPGTYFWIVQAIDAAGNISEQSSIRSFIVN